MNTDIWTNVCFLLTLLLFLLSISFLLILDSWFRFHSHTPLVRFGSVSCYDQFCINWIHVCHRGVEMLTSCAGHIKFFLSSATPPSNARESGCSGPRVRTWWSRAPCGTSRDMQLKREIEIFAVLSCWNVRTVYYHSIADLAQGKYPTQAFHEWEGKYRSSVHMSPSCPN